MAFAIELALAVIPAIIAIILHELAHGLAAYALGDDTARRAGRLSLNPIRHVDRFGTIILPGILLLGQLATIGRVGFMFGWAKPVPVDMRRLRHPRQGMMLVAAAGPAMNAALAMLGALLLRAVPLLPPATGTWTIEFLVNFVIVNLALGLFNLLPIPPLDGGRIVVGLLPLRAALAYARLERAGLLIVIGLVVILPMLLRQAGIAFDPVMSVLGGAVEWAFGHVMSLAGTSFAG